MDNVIESLQGLKNADIEKAMESFKDEDYDIAIDLLDSAKKAFSGNDKITINTMIGVCCTFEANERLLYEDDTGFNDSLKRFGSILEEVNALAESDFKHAQIALLNAASMALEFNINERTLAESAELKEQMEEALATAETYQSAGDQVRQQANKARNAGLLKMVVAGGAAYYGSQKSFRINPVKKVVGYGAAGAAGYSAVGDLKEHKGLSGSAAALEREAERKQGEASEYERKSIIKFEKVMTSLGNLTDEAKWIELHRDKFSGGTRNFMDQLINQFRDFSVHYWTWLIDKGLDAKVVQEKIVKFGLPGSKEMIFLEEQQALEAASEKSKTTLAKLKSAVERFRVLIMAVGFSGLLFMWPDPNDIIVSIVGSDNLLFSLLGSIFFFSSFAFLAAGMGSAASITRGKAKVSKKIMKDMQAKNLHQSPETFVFTNCDYGIGEQNYGSAGIAAKIVGADRSVVGHTKVVFNLEDFKFSFPVSMHSKGSRLRSFYPGAVDEFFIYNDMSLRFKSFWFSEKIKLQNNGGITNLKFTRAGYSDIKDWMLTIIKEPLVWVSGALTAYFSRLAVKGPVISSEFITNLNMDYNIALLGSIASGAVFVATLIGHTFFQKKISIEIQENTIKQEEDK